MPRERPTYDDKRAEAPLCPCGRFYAVNGGGYCRECRRQLVEAFREARALVAARPDLAAYHLRARALQGGNDL